MDEEDLPDAWRATEEAGGSAYGNVTGVKGGWVDAAAPPSPSAPSTPYSPRSDRSAEVREGKRAGERERKEREKPWFL